MNNTIIVGQSWYPEYKNRGTSIQSGDDIYYHDPDAECVEKKHKDAVDFIDAKLSDLYDVRHPQLQTALQVSLSDYDRVRSGMPKRMQPKDDPLIIKGKRILSKRHDGIELFYHALSKASEKEIETVNDLALLELHDVDRRYKSKQSLNDRPEILKSEHREKEQQAIDTLEGIAKKNPEEFDKYKKKKIANILGTLSELEYVVDPIWGGIIRGVVDGWQKNKSHVEDMYLPIYRRSKQKVETIEDIDSSGIVNPIIKKSIKAEQARLSGRAIDHPQKYIESKRVRLLEE